MPSSSASSSKVEKRSRPVRQPDHVRPSMRLTSFRYRPWSCFFLVNQLLALELNERLALAGWSSYIVRSQLRQLATKLYSQSNLTRLSPSAFSLPSCRRSSPLRFNAGMTGLEEISMTFSAVVFVVIGDGRCGLSTSMTIYYSI